MSPLAVNVEVAFRDRESKAQNDSNYFNNANIQTVSVDICKYKVHLSVLALGANSICLISISML